MKWMMKMNFEMNEWRMNEMNFEEWNEMEEWMVNKAA